jgi:hypothetical protein
MAINEKQVGLSVYKVDWDYIVELAGEWSVPKSHVMRMALRIGMRELLTRHPNPELIERYQAVLKKGLDEETRANAERFRKVWGLIPSIEASHANAR